MGTMLWQFNDCWPVTSWSITDYSRQRKAAWYAVREGYRDGIKVENDQEYPKDLILKKPTFVIKPDEAAFLITSNVDAKYVYVYEEDRALDVADNYFDLKAGETKKVKLQYRYFGRGEEKRIKVKSLYDVLNK